MLLWVRDAPVIGQVDPDKVLVWIQERITCHIPDKASDPELHKMVPNAQVQRVLQAKEKCGSVFITKCKFGFPRQECENAKLNSVQESLKSWNRIYNLTHTETEVRVNDYNPCF